VTDATEGEGTWARLTRRKVVQWGIAYAAGAWGLLQGVQFLAEAFEWPTRVLKLSTFALLVGLPIVLVVAWYHGDRGEQRVGVMEQMRSTGRSVDLGGVLKIEGERVASRVQVDGFLPDHRVVVVDPCAEHVVSACWQ
jgi:hypothetical protein